METNTCSYFCWMPKEGTSLFFDTEITLLVAEGAFLHDYIHSHIIQGI